MIKETIIGPTRPWFKIDPAEIWRYRELFYIFVWRDLKVRYKQTFLGVVWVLFQPSVTAGVFSIFFGKIAKIPSGSLPYPLFVYAGLMVWTFFSNSLGNASHSLTGSEALVKKIYFPRVILPLSAVLTNYLDMAITAIVLVIMLFYFRIVPSILTLVFLPVMVISLFLAVSGMGMFLSSVNVKYRDVRLIIPFFVQIGLFVTPIIYPLSVIYDYRRWFITLNPLTGIIENFRLVLSGASSFDLPLLLMSVVVSFFIFLFGLFYLQKAEADFADIL